MEADEVGEMSDRNSAVQVSAEATAALWRCYATSPTQLCWPRATDAVDRRDASVLEEMLCGLRQQQLFQLHLLRQLQRQIDQLVVGEALLGAARTQQQVPAAAGPGRSPSTSPPDHATSGSAAAMTSQSPMSAMMDMSRKRLSELPTTPAARTPPAERE